MLVCDNGQKHDECDGGPKHVFDGADRSTNVGNISGVPPHFRLILDEITQDGGTTALK